MNYGSYVFPFQLDWDPSFRCYPDWDPSFRQFGLGSQLQTVTLIGIPVLDIYPVSSRLESRLQTVTPNGIPDSDIYPEWDPDSRCLSWLIPTISPGFLWDPDGFRFRLLLGYDLRFYS